MVGGNLLSHRVAPAVPSALWSLTSVFGMGTGGASELSPPTKVTNLKKRIYRDGVEACPRTKKTYRGTSFSAGMERGSWW